MKYPSEANPADEYFRITRLQNFGIDCPYCHARQGHYSHCRLFSQSATPASPSVTDSPESFSLPEGELKTIESYRPRELKLTQDDSIRLSGLGVLWDAEENGACWHPIC